MPDLTTTELCRSVDVILFGAGGHARVLLDIVDLLHPSWRVAVVARDGEAQPLGSRAAVWGSDVLLPHLAAGSPGAGFVVGVGSIAPGPLRKRLFDGSCEAGFVPTTLIHPTAIVSKTVVLGGGVQAMAGCVLNPGARIGKNVILNTASIVEHDCVVEDHAHVSPGAVLSGGVIVGAGAHIGAGAVIRQGIRVGELAQVGAGAVVVKDVEPGSLVIGVPARRASWSAGAK